MKRKKQKRTVLEIKQNERIKGVNKMTDNKVNKHFTGSKRNKNCKRDNGNDGECKT